MLGLCDRFKCLPSQLYNEDVDLIRMVTIQNMGTKPREEEVEDDGEQG